MVLILNILEETIDGLLSVLHLTDGAIVAMIVWYLDLQLHKQSVPITTNDVSLNLDHGEVYNIM
jgi:hypothetical protein